MARVNGIEQPEGYPYVTLNHGAMYNDWTPVVIWWNPDTGGFAEPFDIHTVRSPARHEARLIAVDWADALGMDYREPTAA